MQLTNIIIKILCFAFRNILIKIAFRSFAANHFFYAVHSSSSCCIIFKMTIFLQQIFQICQFFVCTGNAHRSGQIAYQAGSTAALSLNAFTGTGNPIGIDVRNITCTDIRIAGIAHSIALSRQPLQITMRSHVNHGIRPPDITQPMIKAKIMMCRCAIRRMVYLTGVIAKTARRLNRNKNIAVEHTGNNQHIAVAKNFPRCFAPVA